MHVPVQTLGQGAGPVAHRGSHADGAERVALGVAADAVSMADLLPLSSIAGHPHDVPMFR